MALTPSQSAAVQYDDNLILFAGPGSGKTSTSVEKGFRILKTPGNRLCMVTFTAAAAQESRERMVKKFASEQLAQPGTRLICGTFHALAKRHLAEHSRSGKRMLTPAAQNGMVNGMLSVVEPAQRKEYTLWLGKYQGALNQEGVVFPDTEIETFVLEYHRRLQQSNTTDLGMTMRECARMMSAGELPLFNVTHLLGDEMQDADEIQLEMVLAHTRRGVITTLVGDDDQCIYEWRSALGYAGMQHFAKESGAKTISLKENFRSREEVVAHAKRLIAFNDPDRIEKNQRATRGPGGELGHAGHAGILEQCDHVVDYIKSRRQPDEGMAVLARTNIALGYMARCLNEECIPCVQDGDTLWDLPPVAVLVSAMQAITTESSSHLLPLLSVLDIENGSRRVLQKHLTKNSAELFIEGALPDLPDVQANDMKLMKAVSTSFGRWRSKLVAGEVNLAIPQIVDDVCGWYSDHISASSASDASKRNQRKKIREAYDSVTKVLMKLQGTLSQRLQRVSQFKEEEKDPMAVRLLTMHGSKGLEFDTVFLIDACEPDTGETLINEASERRLFYVAITRAKERFFALYSDTPSPFIFEADLPQMD